MDKKADQLRLWREWMRQELRACVDFWLEHGMDREHGGVYTCLDRTGQVYSTDKSVWMQGRCGWTFSWLCSVYGPRQEWLDAAKSCLDFMERYCRNQAAEGRLYFSVTAEGKPLRQRRYCLAEDFYAMANAEYYGVTGQREALDRARWAYDVVWQLNRGLMADPTGLGPKTIPETRASRGLSDLMLYMNVTSVLRRTDPERAALYDERAAVCAGEILRYNVRPELHCTLESVARDGSTRLYCTEGRAVNPGHDIECAWLLTEYADRIGDESLRAQAEQVFCWAAQGSWDEQYGGFLYLLDCLGKPPEAYEHDMKLWWPHSEGLICSLMLYRDTGEEKYLQWFERILNYCQGHFADPANGEWYGYLRRDGLPTEPSTKGSSFKGPFHVPRCLAMCDVMLAGLLGEQPGRFPERP